MKTLELLGKTVKVDTDKISAGLKEIDPEIHIGCGIFKFELMDMAEKNIKKAVFNQFEPSTQDLFNSRLKQFVSECMHDITCKLF